LSTTYAFYDSKGNVISEFTHQTPLLQRQPHRAATHVSITRPISLCAGRTFLQDISKEVTAHLTVREKVPTSIDMPLSNECKRILAYSAEEAERLAARLMGGGHVLLGMLRE